MGKGEQSSGNSKKVAFVACSKTKKKYTCKARDLYQGALFRKALEYVEQNYSQVYILSAKHGILHLNDQITPYEKTLNLMSKQELINWYNLVREQMVQFKLIGPKVFFTGHIYNEPFEGEKPLHKLSLGKQLQWFDQKKKLRYTPLI